MIPAERSADFYPCGCLRNSADAHRGDCPYFETVRLVSGTNRLDEMTWVRRPDPMTGCPCGPMPMADGYVYGCPVHDPNPPVRNEEGR